MKFVEITTQYKNLKVAIIFKNVTNAPIGITAPEITKNLKANKKFFIFDDFANSKLIDSNPKLAKEFAKPINQGDAYMYFGGEIKKLERYCRSKVNKLYYEEYL